MKKQIEWERMFVDETEGQLPDTEEDEAIMESMGELGLDLEPLPVIHLSTTPMGVFNLHDKNMPLKTFDFWVGYTNFKIGPVEVEFIDKFCDGIETFKVITPYRFLISIAKLYDNRKVRMDIESRICDKHKIFVAVNSIPNEDVQEKVRNSISAAEEFTYWVVYILPDGQVGYKTYDSEEKYDEEYEQFDVMCQTTGSLVLTHEDK